MEAVLVEVAEPAAAWLAATASAFEKAQKTEVEQRQTLEDRVGGTHVALMGTQVRSSLLQAIY